MRTLIPHPKPQDKRTEQDWVEEQFGQQVMGYACELGAHDGTHKTNTLNLERRGWTVLCIEPNPRHQAALRACRKLVYSCACDKSPGWATLREFAPVAHWTKTTIRTEEAGLPVAHVPVLTLDQCLATAGFFSLDLLSLDVDGIEIDILAGFDVKRWQPKALILECVEGDNDPTLQWARYHGYQVDALIGDYNHCMLKDWK